jgi:hypothetical protein
MSEASKRTQDWLKKNLQEVWDKEVWPILPHFCLFRFVSADLLLVSVQPKHRNSLFRYSAETSFGSSFGCFESKLFSKDTLL